MAATLFEVDAGAGRVEEVVQNSSHGAQRRTRFQMRTRPVSGGRLTTLAVRLLSCRHDLSDHHPAQMSVKRTNHFMSAAYWQRKTVSNEVCKRLPEAEIMQARGIDVTVRSSALPEQIYSSTIATFLTDQAGTNTRHW